MVVFKGINGNQLWEASCVENILIPMDLSLIRVEADAGMVIRKRKIQEMLACFSRGNKILIVSGMSGIGKGRIVRQFLATNEDAYSFCHIKSLNSADASADDLWRKVVKNLGFVREIEEMCPLTDPNDAILVKWAALQKLDKNAIVFVENARNIDSKSLKRFMQLQCRFIFSTSEQYDFEEVEGISEIKLDFDGVDVEQDFAEMQQIFLAALNEGKKEDELFKFDEAGLLRDLFHKLGYYTYAIVLCARLISEHRKSIREVYSLVSSNTIFGIYDRVEVSSAARKTVYELVLLRLIHQYVYSAEEIKLMGLFPFFDRNTINFEVIEQYFSPISRDAVLSLHRKGLLVWNRENNSIKMNQLCIDLLFVEIFKNSSSRLRIADWDNVISPLVVNGFVKMIGFSHVSSFSEAESRLEQLIFLRDRLAQITDHTDQSLLIRLNEGYRAVRDFSGMTTTLNDLYKSHLTVSLGNETIVVAAYDSALLLYSSGEYSSAMEWVNQALEHSYDWKTRGRLSFLKCQIVWARPKIVNVNTNKKTEMSIIKKANDDLVEAYIRVFDTYISAFEQKLTSDDQEAAFVGASLALVGLFTNTTLKLNKANVLIRKYLKTILQQEIYSPSGILYYLVASVLKRFGSFAGLTLDDAERLVNNPGIILGSAIPYWKANHLYKKVDDSYKKAYKEVYEVLHYFFERPENEIQNTETFASYFMYYSKVMGGLGFPFNYVQTFYNFLSIVDRFGAKSLCIDVCHGYEMVLKEVLPSLNALIQNEFLPALDAFQLQHLWGNSEAVLKVISMASCIPAFSKDLIKAPVRFLGYLIDTIMKDIKDFSRRYESSDILLRERYKRQQQALSLLLLPAREALGDLYANYYKTGNTKALAEYEDALEIVNELRPQDFRTISRLKQKMGVADFVSKRKIAYYLDAIKMLNENNIHNCSVCEMYEKCAGVSCKELEFENAAHYYLKMIWETFRNRRCTMFSKCFIEKVQTAVKHLSNSQGSKEDAPFIAQVLRIFVDFLVVLKPSAHNYEGKVARVDELMRNEKYKMAERVMLSALKYGLRAGNDREDKDNTGTAIIRRDSLAWYYTKSNTLCSEERQAIFIKQFIKKFAKSSDFRQSRLFQCLCYCIGTPDVSPEELYAFLQEIFRQRLQQHNSDMELFVHKAMRKCDEARKSSRSARKVVERTESHLFNNFLFGKADIGFMHYPLLIDVLLDTTPKLSKCSWEQGIAIFREMITQYRHLNFRNAIKYFCIQQERYATEPNVVYGAILEDIRKEKERQAYYLYQKRLDEEREKRQEEERQRREEMQRYKEAQQRQREERQRREESQRQRRHSRQNNLAYSSDVVEAVQARVYIEDNRVSDYRYVDSTILREVVLSEYTSRLGKAFLAGTSVESLHIPKSVVSMAYALCGANNLSNLQFDEDIKSIPDHAFASLGDMEALIGVQILTGINNVVALGRGAFSRCNSWVVNDIFKHLPLLERIENNAFEGCPNLHSVALRLRKSFLRME